MPHYIEVFRMFAPDESSESDISHYIEHDHGQCGDGTQEAEDQTRTEDNTDESETNNLEDLLYMNGNIGCLVYRVNLSQSRWECPSLRHRVHDAGSSVGAGNPYSQCPINDGKEDEHPAYAPELLGQGVM